MHQTLPYTEANPAIVVLTTFQAASKAATIILSDEFPLRTCIVIISAKPVVAFRTVARMEPARTVAFTALAGEVLSEVPIVMLTGVRALMTVVFAPAAKATSIRA